jgi:hypothetical protein
MLAMFIAGPLVAAHVASGVQTREIARRGVVVRAEAREDAAGRTHARIRIRRGRTVQTFELSPRYVDASMLLESIAIVDVNFDGHADVTVLREFGAKWGALDAFVFDARRGRFSATSRIARAIASLTNATFDEKRRAITTHDIGPSNPERITYAVDHDRLRVVASCRFLNPFNPRIGTLVRTRGSRTTTTTVRLGPADVDPCAP